jgi:peroxiredoxin (alkyl hydroperoxide reductase subunit C)
MNRHNKRRYWKAMITTTENRMPRILEDAPNFQAKTTQGVIELSNYTSKGKWVMLFSHPSDFTPRLHNGVH